jgi:hypothetical protein
MGTEIRRTHLRCIEGIGSIIVKAHNFMNIDSRQSGALDRLTVLASSTWDPLSLVLGHRDIIEFVELLRLFITFNILTLL